MESQDLLVDGENKEIISIIPMDGIWNKMIATLSKPSKPSQQQPLRSLPLQNNNTINKPPNQYIYPQQNMSKWFGSNCNA